ncbi:MAG: hypothetical protein DI536_08100 [Archangium gephyra]|uniref:DUF4132 domain-containing protein n=1 Tax=Archangium gephyra TaxID=48 RepID=A0A2W5VHH8_9BACT|nr:MAG: hypothetical protein DI536_08100 [Archangium gephyra]
MASPRINWTPEALSHVTPSRHHDLVKAELRTAAVAWNELRKWIASVAATVTPGIDPALTVHVCTLWGGEAPPARLDVVAAGAAWRLLGQGGGEKQFATFITRAFGFEQTLEAFVVGPPVQVTFNDRHFGAPATPLGSDAWKAMRVAWLATSEAERARLLPLALMLEETTPSLADVRAQLGDLDWAKVQAVHALRFDLLAQFGADAAPLLIEALGVGREHGMGVELQRDFVATLALVESPEVAEHLKAEAQLDGTKDLVVGYPRRLAESTCTAVDFRAAHDSQRRWTREEFQAELLHNADARGLVWATYEDGFILDTFRIGADGALTVGSGDEYELPDDAPIGLAHDGELDAITRKQWRKVLADHELTPPFTQLSD